MSQNYNLDSFENDMNLPLDVMPEDNLSLDIIEDDSFSVYGSVQDASLLFDAVV